MEHRVTGAVRRRAGSLRNSLAEMRGHTTERSLVNPTLLGSRERHSVVLQLDDRCGRLLAHELNGVLVSEPVGTLDGVVHVPTPIGYPHVSEGSTDTALGRHGVTARRKEF